MGIVNATPDSFSDKNPTLKEALDHAYQLEKDGADILDIGGESTRPGSCSVPVEEECARVLPLIRILVKESSLPVSIDTQKEMVARAALDAGASIVNHVSSSLDFANMLATVASHNAGYVAMHMLARPKTMQKKPEYKDAVEEVILALSKVAIAAEEAGLPSNNILYDPGIGFGKRLEHNLALMKQISLISRRLNRPLLMGISRKSWLSQIMEEPLERNEERDILTAIASSLLQQNGGVFCHRVHNVKLVKQALKLSREIGETETWVG